MNEVTRTDSRPPLVVLRDRLEARKGEIQTALVDIPADRFIRAIITSAQINPEILACEWQSIWTACMRACRDGLLPDGVDGAIVGFKGRAQWLPMYQGLLRRFRRSGQFKWIAANVVRKGEDFEHYVDEDGEHFRHYPKLDSAAPIIAVYAVATLKDGGFFCAALPIDEADKIRNVSRTTREDSPWKQWPVEMYKKTALRRLCKMLPSARDIIDDEYQDEPPEEKAAPALQRDPGARAALEKFAGDAPASSSVRAGHGESSADVSFPDRGEDSPLPSADDQYRQALEAYRLGQEEKSSGKNLEVPMHIRADDQLNDAWIAGYVGEPFSYVGKEDAAGKE